MTYAQFQSSGIYTTNPPGDTPLNFGYSSFLANPAANRLGTPSGSFEAYSQAIVEDYCARGYNNIDATTSLMNGATLFDPNSYTSSNKTATSTSGRFVYPIPMYIPLAEGRFANEDPTTGGTPTRIPWGLAPPATT